MIKLTFEVREGNVINDIRAQAFIYALKKFEGNPYASATWLGITPYTVVSNAAKYGLSDLIKECDKLTKSTDYEKYK